MPQMLNISADAFPDIANEWYTPYINRAKFYGLVQGSADGLFHPKDSVTRAEVTAIVVRGFEKNAAISLIGSGAVLVAIYFMFKRV